MNLTLFSYDTFKGNTDSSFQLLHNLAQNYPDEYNLLVYAVKRNGRVFQGQELMGNIKIKYNLNRLEQIETKNQRLFHKSLKRYPQPFSSIPRRIQSSSDISFIQYPFPINTIPYILSKSRLKIYFLSDMEGHKLFSYHSGLIVKIKNYLQNQIINNSDSFVVHSRFAADFLEHHFGKSSILLPHGYHKHLFKKYNCKYIETLKTNLGLQGKKTIVWAGHVVPEKREGFSILLQAIKTIHFRHPELRLLIIGGRKFFSEKWILNIPPQPYEKIPLFLSLSDMVVLPKYDNIVQRWSIHVVKMVEAMASGKPVITSPIGFADSIPNNIFYNVKPNDIKSISQGIEQLLEDEDLAQTIGDSGKKYAEQNFCWNTIAEKFHRYLKKNFNNDIS